MKRILTSLVLVTSLVSGLAAHAQEAAPIVRCDEQTKALTKNGDSQASNAVREAYVNAYKNLERETKRLDQAAKARNFKNRDEMLQFMRVHREALATPEGADILASAAIVGASHARMKSLEECAENVRVNIQKNK